MDVPFGRKTNWSTFRFRILIDLEYTYFFQKLYFREYNLSMLIFDSGGAFFGPLKISQFLKYKAKLFLEISFL